MLRNNAIRQFSLLSKLHSFSNSRKANKNKLNTPGVVEEPTSVSSSNKKEKNILHKPGEQRKLADSIVAKHQDETAETNSRMSRAARNKSSPSRRKRISRKERINSMNPESQKKSRKNNPNLKIRTSRSPITPTKKRRAKSETRSPSSPFHQPQRVSRSRSKNSSPPPSSKRKHKKSIPSIKRILKSPEVKKVTAGYNTDLAYLHIKPNEVKILPTMESVDSSRGSPERDLWGLPIRKGTSNTKLTLCLSRVLVFLDYYKKDIASLFLVYRKFTTKFFNFNFYALFNFFNWFIVIVRNRIKNLTN
jgi:hypothetical protein